MEVGLVGDSRRSLRALLPLLKGNEDEKFLEQARAGMQVWRKAHGRTRHLARQTDEAAGGGMGAGPASFGQCHDLGRFRHCYQLVGTLYPGKRGQLHAVSGNLASMACSLPYAIAAQIAYPDRPSIAFVGDGGFSMLMADFVTCVKYQLPVKVVVIKNNYPRPD